MISKAKKTIVITGSNKGIGYSILEKLLKDNPAFEFIMGVRSLENGKQALQKLTKIVPNAESRVHIEQLDLASSDSISQFVSRLPKTIGKVDALINNGAIAWKGDAFDANVVKTTFETNYYGTIELTEKMIDLINDNGKIITIGSQAGLLRILKNERLKQAYSDLNITKEQLNELSKQFYDSVADNTYAAKGFPKSAYGMSKLSINLYTTRVLAKREDILRRNIQVYGLCPGWCKTDMAGYSAPRTAEQGAETPVALINLPWEINKGYQGQFFYEERVISL